MERWEIELSVNENKLKTIKEYCCMHKVRTYIGLLICYGRKISSKEQVSNQPKPSHIPHIKRVSPSLSYNEWAQLFNQLGSLIVLLFSDSNES